MRESKSGWRLMLEPVLLLIIRFPCARWRLYDREGIQHGQTGSFEGLITLPSGLGPEETMDRLETDIRAQGMRVFAGLITRLWPRRRD